MLNSTALGLVAASVLAGAPDLAVVRGIVAERARDMTPLEMERLATAVHRDAARAQIDPLLVLAVIEVESAFRNGRRSRAGALGLMQVLPSTGAAFAERAGVAWSAPEETLFDPDANVRLGVTYLSYLLRIFDRDLDHALAAYCHGPGRIRGALRELGEVPARRLRYAAKVRLAWDRLRRATRRVPTGPTELSL